MEYPIDFGSPWQLHCVNGVSGTFDGFLKISIELLDHPEEKEK